MNAQQVYTTLRRQILALQQRVGAGGGGGGGGISALTGDITASGSGSVAATIANDAVTNAKAANMTAGTYKMRVTASTGDPEDATATQATAGLNAVLGDSGSGGTKGLVPAPGAGDTAANKFLKANGVWTVPSAGGTIQNVVYDNGFLNSSLSSSGSAFASKGLFITPSVNVSITFAYPYFTPVNGANYKVVILEVNGSRVVQAVTGTSTARTISGTVLTYYQFVFGTPVALTAGVTYAVMLVRTDSTTTYALPLQGATASGNFVVIPVTAAAYIARLASVNPAVSDTIDNNSSAAGWFQISLAGTY